MAAKKQDIFSEFTKSIIKTQLRFKTFLRARFREHNVDITFEMMQILLRLWEQDGINQQELANMTFKDKASLTYLIDNLAKRGLVERTEDANDRRNKLIILTAEGLRLKKQILPWIDEMYAVAGQGISAEELKTGIKLFAAIHDNLSREAE